MGDESRSIWLIVSERRPFWRTMVDSIRGGSAFSSAVSGIRSAVADFEDSAARVASSGASIGASQDTVDLSPQARALASGGPPEGSFTKGMIDENMAKYRLAANIRVAHAADETTDSLLQMVKG